MIITAFMLGLVCGVAWAHAPRFRVALTAYMAVLAGTHVLGVTAPNILIDLIILCGALLLCFGVTRGLVAMIWERTPDAKPNIPPTVCAGPTSALPTHKPGLRTKPRQVV